MLYIIMVGLLVLSGYWIVVGLSLLLSVGSTLVAVPIAALVRLGQRLGGTKGDLEVDRRGVLERSEKAVMDAERVLNKHYELRYDRDDAPEDVDENGIPYL